MKRFLLFAETLLIALLGVAIFNFIHIPLPWLIGSLVSIAVWHVSTQRQLLWPLTFRQIAMVMLGYLTGTSFTKDALIEMGNHIPSMIVITLLTILFSLMLGWMFARLTGQDLTSSLIASIPGGLSQIMLLLDDIKGLNATIIMFIQSTRVMMIVVIVPLLTVALFGVDTETVRSQLNADTLTWGDMPWYTFGLYPLLMVMGAWLFQRLRIPTALLLGPLGVTLVFTLIDWPTPDLPESFVNVAQLFIGVHIGRQMDPRSLPDWKRMIAYTFSVVALLILFGIGMGAALTLFYDISFTTALLATAPGGMVELIITALSIGGDISVITSYQLFRLLVVLLFIPIFFKWFVRRQHRQ